MHCPSSKLLEMKTKKQLPQNVKLTIRPKTCSIYLTPQHESGSSVSTERRVSDIPAKLRGSARPRPIWRQNRRVMSFVLLNKPS